MKVIDVENFISRIPTNGYFGATYGIKNKKKLSLHLLSLDENYNVKDTFNVNPGTSINDTFDFQNLKRTLIRYGFNEFNHDPKYSKVIFPKNESLSFFTKADSAGLFGANKIVYMYFIYDMYKKQGVEFPNVLFSNKQNITQRDLNSYSKTSFLLGNEGQACCPPK